MFKLFSFRMTPFFLGILALECMALLISIYLGVLLYQGAAINISTETFAYSNKTNIVLFMLIFILAPGFFSQLKIIHYLKKSFDELMPGLIVAVLSMALIVTSMNNNLDARLLFLAAVLSVSLGILTNKLSLLNKYWRLLIRKGVN